MHTVSEFPPLPNLEVNPLQDFFDNQYNLPLSPFSIHIKEECESPVDFSLTEMLPAFNEFFGQNFNESFVSEVNLELTSSKSDSLAANEEDLESTSSKSDSLVANEEDSKSPNTKSDSLAANEEDLESTSSKSDSLVANEEDSKSPNTKSDSLAANEEDLESTSSKSDSLDANEEDSKSTSSKSVSLAVNEESTSSKSDSLLVNIDRNTTSDIDMDPQVRHPEGLKSAVTAPVWIPPVADECRELRKRKRRISSSPSRSPPSSPAYSSPPNSPVTLRTQRPSTSTLSRRRSANERERRRTKVLIDAFSTLRETIPLPEEEKATKIQTVKAATFYIEFLHEVYATSAYQSIHDAVPKNAKVGVIYALHAMQEMNNPKRFYGNSEALTCAFNLYLSERKLNDMSPPEITTKKRKISRGDSNKSSMSPSSSSSTSSSPTMAPLSPVFSHSHVGGKPGCWTLDC